MSPGPRWRVFLCLLLLCSVALPAAAQSSASIALDPDCGPETTGQSEEPPYEIAVQGSGFQPNDDVEIYFSGERQDNPEAEDVMTDENGAFTVLIRPARRAAGTYEVEALQRNGDGTVSSRASVSFTVPCAEPEPTAEPTAEPTPSGPVLPPKPTLPPPPRDREDKKDKRKRTKDRPSLELDMAVGPPGSVVEVRGRNFGPRRELVLDWDRGIGTVRVQTDEKGRFDTDVLILPNDVVGPRRLVVTARGARANVRFLVVPSTASPPDFDR